MTNSKIHTMTLCAAFAALLCVCSPISVPLGPVPVTACVFLIMLSSVILDTKKALIAVAVYIFAGAFGLPVFSGYCGGISVIVGPTGGYIWSYLLMVSVVGGASGIKVNNKYIKFILIFSACLLSIAICYFCGTFQYVLVTGCNVNAALVACVYGFVVFDLIKALAASYFGLKIKKRLGKYL